MSEADNRYAGPAALMARRMGVVLGAGGERVIAWQWGVLAGLADRGLDLRCARSIVGTSAGALVAARLALGHDPRIEALVSQDSEAPATVATGLTVEEASQRVAGQWAAVSSLAPEQRRRELVRAALEAETIDEEAHVGLIAQRVGAHDRWPAALRLAAVDARNGGRVTLDQAAGVSVARAVAAARALPVLLPPVTVGDRRCIDAAIESATNCDRLDRNGTDLVIVIAPIAPRPAAGSLDHAWASALQRELADLRRSGMPVVLIRANEADLAAMGDHLFSAAHAARAGLAGRERGRAALRGSWVLAPTE